MWFQGKKAASEIKVIDLEQSMFDNLNAVALKLGGKVSLNNHKKSQILYVIHFSGDIMATQGDALAKMVSTIISAGDPKFDHVMIKVESPGGAAYAYGYASSQLQRLRDAGFKLVTSIDKVAASGGYMMACVSDKVIAAPFAVVGSIGVVIEMPNFSEILSKIGIKYSTYTAGKFKRTISPFSQPTQDAEEKVREDLKNMHRLFSAHVSSARGSKIPDIDVVTTGETWSGSEAVKLGLVDEVKTSDDYIMEHLKTHRVIQLERRVKRNIFGDPVKTVANMISETIISVIYKLANFSY